jgi:hypothetical protein
MCPSNALIAEPMSIEPERLGSNIAEEKVSSNWLACELIVSSWRTAALVKPKVMEMMLNFTMTGNEKRNECFKCATTNIRTLEPKHIDV